MCVVWNQMKGCKSKLGDCAVELCEVIGSIWCLVYNNHGAEVVWLHLVPKVGLDA